MPSALHKPKQYGTGRRAGTLTKSFRGSARAWDSQRKHQGLLLQRPSAVPVASGTRGSDSDDDDDDSFVLESPPQSPLVERAAAKQVLTSNDAGVDDNEDVDISPVKQQHAPTMPVHLRTRQPLIPKPDNQLNQLQPPSTPKNKPKQRNSCARRESRIPEPVCQPAETETFAHEEVVVAAASAEVEVEVEVELQQGYAQEQTAVKRRETFAVEIVSSRRSITPPLEAEAAEPQPQGHSEQEEEEEAVEYTQSESDGSNDDNEEEEEEEEEYDEDDVQEIEEYDESVFISPEKRGELHNEARRRGRIQEGPALAVKDPEIITGLRSLTLHSPPSTPTKQPQTNVTPTPKPTKKPKGLVTPPVEIPNFERNSKIHSLLPVCDKPQIISYTEYLQTISSDFSHIKKIGESSFAEVYIHKRDDGRSVVLKFVPMTTETNVMEVLQELKTTRALSPIPGFIKYLGCQVVCTRIPPELEAAWRLWEEKNNSRYDPTIPIYVDTPYHAIIALEDGGCSLEDTRWSTWDVPLEIFRQTISAFAQAERDREFEHRDLHSGNLLVRDVKKEREVGVREDSGVGRSLEVTHAGFEDVVVTMIDYTLSRAKIPEEVGGGVAFMEMEEGMFEAEGLYQFDIYRIVRDEVVKLVAAANGHPTTSTNSSTRRSERINKPDWSLYCPRSNVIWLHFLIKQLIRSDDGRRNDGKLRIWKPSKAKKNAFDLACWGMVMRIHEVLDAEVDADGARFGGAVDIERWCLEEGVFGVLDEERARRRGETLESEVVVVAGVEKEVQVEKRKRGGKGGVRRSERLRK
ncbi:hypothetical protein TWF730_004814 [Orbilia blumenaviensis]|uniref:non-specific serine/threonine protein kinase n=1 Tax=Orbilia blumenaviensis TaxID=1796055 RepID=A0AAV9TZF2_9PEZI